MHVTVQDQGFRDYMEDTVIAEDNIVNGLNLYCIFDGHGGSFVSEYLRDHFSDMLKEEIRTNNAPIPDQIISVFKKINETIPKERCLGTGSTALVALQYGEVVFVANCGDCRAILSYNEIARAVTEDHKPNITNEIKRIYEGGGFVTQAPGDVPRVNGMLAVSRSIGDLHLYPHVTWQPDLYMVKVDKINKLLVMASDGLWDAMSNQNVLDIIMDKIMINEGLITQDVLNDAAVRCVMMAKAKGSRDNISIIIKAL